jgi:hypothetical protein
MGPPLLLFPRTYLAQQSRLPHMGPVRHQLIVVVRTHISPRMTSN